MFVAGIGSNAHYRLTFPYTRYNSWSVNVTKIDALHERYILWLVFRLCQEAAPNTGPAVPPPYELYTLVEIN